MKGISFVAGMVLAGLIALASNRGSPLAAREFVQEPWVAPNWADTVKSTISLNADAALKGKDNFDLYCWSCHGKKGLGDGAAGASFPIKPANLTTRAVTSQSDGALFWKLSTGRGNMPGYGELLGDAERWELVAYIRTLSNHSDE